MAKLIAVDDFSPVIKVSVDSVECALPCTLLLGYGKPLKTDLLTACDSTDLIHVSALINSDKSDDSFLNKLYPTSQSRRIRLYHVLNSLDNMTESILACGVPSHVLNSEKKTLDHVQEAIKNNLVKSVYDGKEEQHLPITKVAVFPIEYTPFYDVALSDERESLPLDQKVYFVDVMEKKTTVSGIENGVFAKQSDGSGLVETFFIGRDLFYKEYSCDGDEESIPEDIKDEYFSYLMTLLSINFGIGKKERIYWSGIGAVFFENQIKSGRNNRIIANPEFSKVRGLFKFAQQKINHSQL
ncbi:MAG: hypothetical protein U9N57_00965 [Pseudomonadota bacterium]|nr:hypothetical protein [Pseudomonadota bacterium]